MSLNPGEALGYTRGYTRAYTRGYTRGYNLGYTRGYNLGSLLYILLVNDICNVSLLLLTILFADNTCVLVTSKPLSGC